MNEKKKNNNKHATTYMQQHTCNNIQLQNRKPHMKSYGLWITPCFNVELLKQLKWKHKLCDNRECRLYIWKYWGLILIIRLKLESTSSQRNVSTSIQYPPTHIYLSQETSYSPPGVLWALLVLSTVTYNWRISTRRNHAIFLKLQ